jgi:hypothetical protein
MLLGKPARALKSRQCGMAWIRWTPVKDGGFAAGYVRLR